MKLTTKFEVNDLIKHKYNTPGKDSVAILEVMEIITQTCYAGTQVFYLCRAIILTKEFTGFNKEDDRKWVVGHSISKDSNKISWERYREDELISINKDEEEIFKESQNQS